MRRRSTHRREKGSEKRRCLDAKLLAYCAAAGGALMAAHPAGAAIVYSGVKNLVLDNSTSPVPVDLDGDGTADFEFANDSFTTYFGYIDRSQNFLDLAQHPQNAVARSFLPLDIYPRPVSAPAAIQRNGGFRPVRLNLDPGTPIPNDNIFWVNGYTYGGYAPLSIGRRFTSGGTVTYFNAYGYFAGRTDFLGINFEMNGNAHYGWIRYRGTDDNGTKLSGTIVDWAYEDVPYTAINAGERGCIDNDGDGYGEGSCKAPDCDDTDPALTDNCTCIDGDGDGYGEGPSCAGPDCDDTDPALTDFCPACSVSFIPAGIGRVWPVAGIIIRGDADASFSESTAIDWGTENIRTIIRLPIGKKLIIALVLTNGREIEQGDTYTVRVGDCAGELTVR